METIDTLYEIIGLNMKIAVINEISSADKNSQIIGALDGFGHEVINLGMKSKEEDHQLQYIHTGLLTALMLNTERADFVVGVAVPELDTSMPLFNIRVFSAVMPSAPWMSGFLLRSTGEIAFPWH